MISAKALGAMPEFIEKELGLKGLHLVMDRSGMPLELLENRESFIPETMLVSFLNQSARETGEKNLGLLISPFLTVADYDLWGDYVLGASTLEASLLRSIKAISLHSSDEVSISSTKDGFTKLVYRFREANEPGYRHISCCAVGAMLSIFREYLGARWCPIRVELDFAKPHHSMVFEDVFECPVIFNSPGTAVVFAATDLQSARVKNSGTVTTLRDVKRARFGGTPITHHEAVWEILMLQLLDSIPSLERTAASMRLGVRKLQRALESEGTNFRALYNLALTQRSVELLIDSELTITRIATQLNYSSPAHFSRSFKKQTGKTPRDFRKQPSEYPGLV